jgi:tRNA-specific 2-thiouridylase
MRKKVIVAMSGGVDSSVAALVLKKEGYAVEGVTLQLIPDSHSGRFSEHATPDIHVWEARRAAKLLDIPHHVLNLKREFHDLVIERFKEEYKTGRTPNPCIRCNRFIKFGILFEASMEMGADYLATGHYAKIEYDAHGDCFFLRRAADPQKDQSYFLYMLDQTLLRSLLLPLGNKTKQEVRRIARLEGLSTSNKSESQEICFIPGNDYRVLFKKNTSSAVSGPIVDRSGNRLGEHTGIINYTIGQRRGLGISAEHPLYVTKMLVNQNTIVVGPRREAFSRGLVAEDVLWSSYPVENAETVYAKIRSLHKEAKACVYPLSEERVRVVFEKPQWAIAPGQAVVFYKNDRVLGGGIITDGENGTAGEDSFSECERRSGNKRATPNESALLKISGLKETLKPSASSSGREVFREQRA